MISLIVLEICKFDILCRNLKFSLVVLVFLKSKLLFTTVSVLISLVFVYFKLDDYNISNCTILENLKKCKYFCNNLLQASKNIVILYIYLPLESS